MTLQRHHTKMGRSEPLPGAARQGVVVGGAFTPLIPWGSFMPSLLEHSFPSLPGEHSHHQLQLNPSPAPWLSLWPIQKPLQAHHLQPLTLALKR